MWLLILGSRNRSLSFLWLHSPEAEMIKMNSEVKSINCTLTNDIALFKILFEVIFVVSTTIQPELFRMSNLYERSEFFVPYARDGIEAPFKAHKNKNH